MDHAATPPSRGGSYGRPSPPSGHSSSLLPRNISYTTQSSPPSGGRAWGGAPAAGAVSVGDASPVRNITYTTASGSPGQTEVSDINISKLTEEATNIIEVQVEEDLEEADALRVSPGSSGAPSPPPPRRSWAPGDAAPNPFPRGPGGAAQQPLRASSNPSPPGHVPYTFLTKGQGRHGLRGGEPGGGARQMGEEDTTAGHYDALLGVLEDLKGECQELKDENARQRDQLAGAAQKEKDAGVVMERLAEELQMREEAVAQLQGVVAQVSSTRQDAQGEAAAAQQAQAQQFEARCHDAERRLRPLQEKTHQQEKYIAQLEARAAAAAGASQESRQTLSEMSIELMKVKHERKAERAHGRRLGMRLAAAAERGLMEAAEARSAVTGELAHRKHLEAGYVQQAQSVLRLKDEQLRLARDDLAGKEAQVDESRALIQDMMQNVQDNVQKLHKIRAERDGLAEELAAARAVIEGLEQKTEAAKDTRKQVRKEVHGVLEKARTSEAAWQKEKARLEELLGKQRDRAQGLAAGKAKLEEAAKTAAQAAKAAQDKYNDLAGAVARLHAQACGDAAAAAELEHGAETDSLLGALRAAGVQGTASAKQRVLKVGDRVAKLQQGAASTRAAQQAAKREAEAAQAELAAAKAHAAWVSEEWDAAKARQARAEEDCARFRDEAHKATAAAREVLAENDQLTDRLARLENGLAVQSDTLSHEKARHSSDVAAAEEELATTRAALASARGELAQAQAAGEEVACLRKRVCELTDVVQALEDAQGVMKEAHAALAAEKGALLDAKSKHQKAASRHMADAKRARADADDLQKKLEGSQRAAEQLRKQMAQKDAEGKALQEKLHALQETVEAKQKAARRDEAKVQALQQEAAAARDQARSLAAELQKVETGAAAAHQERAAALEAELQELQARHADAAQRLQSAEHSLRDEAELRGLVEQELAAMRLEEEKRARVLRERSMATPKKSPNVGERAHQKKQALHRQNALSGVETPYAVLHGRAAAPPAQHTPGSAAGRASPFATPQPRTPASPMPRTGLTKALLGDSPLADGTPQARPKHALKSPAGAARQDGGGREGSTSPTLLRQEAVASVAVVDCCL